MKHNYIQDNQIADLYVMGKLPPTELEKFEEHFMHCVDCQNEIVLSAKLHQAMADTVSENAMTLNEQASERKLAARMSRGLTNVIGWRSGDRTAAGMLDRRWSLTAIAAGVLLPVSALAMLALNQMRVNVLTPNANTPIFQLSAARSGSQAEPVTQFALPQKPGWLVFAMRLPDGTYPRYRVALRDSAGERIWTDDNLVANIQDEIVLSLHASMLEPGDYLIQAEGITVDDAWKPVARFTFRVRRPAGAP